VSEQVLHIDLIALGDHASAPKRNDLIAAATSLRTMEHVLAVGLIEATEESDYDLVVYFLLDSFASLEPFGTDARYSQFLQGSVAPVLRGFAGADVKLESDLTMIDGSAALMAIAAPEETYDWEVREALESWTQSLRADGVAIGVAVGERQRYRGAGIAYGGDALTATHPPESPFSTTIVRGQARRLAW
jgi:hypothetical protein